MKGDWKPREEYKTLVEQHKPILTRSFPTTSQNRGYAPMIVIYTEHGTAKGGHFYPCPGQWLFYGNHEFGMLTHDHFDEWMDIPE